MLEVVYQKISRSSLSSVGIALVSTIILILRAEAFVIEDMDKLDNEYCLNIFSCDKFQPHFMVNHDLANIDVNNDNNIVRNPSKKLLEDLRNLIDKIDDLEVKTEMLINLALQYYQLNELEITKTILNEALEVSKKVKDNSSKTLLMLKIATTYIEIEELETASKILDQAKDSSQKITDNSIKAALLMNLASKYEQIGNSEKAEIITTEVDTIVAKIEDPPPNFPFQPLPFKGQINFGNNLFFAKNTLASFSIGGNFNKIWETGQIDLYVKFLNSYDSSRDSGDENRILFDVVTQYKHYFKETTYLFGNLGYLQNDFSGIDNKFSYFTGLGFNLWRGSTENETFNMQLGIGDLFQNSDIKNKNAPFPVFQYAFVYKDLFFTNWKFEQLFTLEIPVRKKANYFVDSRTMVTIPTINNWSVFTSLDLRYFGVPRFDEPNLSTNFTAGIRYDF